MNLDRRRWVVIAAGIMANLCLGAVYSFSVFKGPLREHLGCSETQVAFAFSLNMAFLPVGMVISGKIADRRSPGLVVALGGVLFGAGMFLAGFTNSVLWLYATFGVMLSLGNGAIYGAVVAGAVKWFPDRRGMASGLVVSALGMGTLIIAPIAQRMIDVPQLGAFGAFKVLGIAFVVIIVAASRFIVNPPAGYVPTNFSPEAASVNGGAQDMSWPRMLTTLNFWLLCVLYFTGAFSGLMVASQASSIAQQLTGLTAAAASVVVGVFGLTNATGRLFWGAVSDRIGRFQALALMFLITAAVMFSFSALGAVWIGLVVAIALVGLCYGGYLGIFPSLCADAFGSRNLMVNYGILFSGFSVAGILGPRISASLRESTGGYAESFVVAGITAGIGLLVALVLVSGLRLNRPQPPSGE